MSGIAGVVCLDGGTADARVTAAMLEALAHRGGRAVLAPADFAAIGSRRAFCAATPDLSATVALHGRLHDREELAAALGVSRAESDPRLIAHAILRWDLACLDRLAGEFSLAAWDGRARRLICAQDVAGTRPLYYVRSGGFFAFATELHALFAALPIPRAANVRMAAQLLCGDLRSGEETLFDGVYRLPAAHVLVLENAHVSVRRYWNPSLRESTEFRTDDEWAEAFAERFHRAIARRIADQPTVGVTLSGGVDSSSVTAVAARQVGASRVRSYTMRHRDGVSCDEREYVHALTDGLGQHATFVEPARWDAKWAEATAARYLNWPGGPRGMPADAAMYEAAARDGVTALLTGEGGDEWLTGSPLRFADFIARRQFVALAGELLHAANRRTAARRLTMLGIWPLVPRRLRRILRAAARTRGARPAPIWMEPDFVRASGIEQTPRGTGEALEPGASRASRDIAQYLSDPAESLAMEFADRGGAPFGVEERHPFFDRDLVEFALTLPETQRYRHGETKRVLRRAMNGLVPDRILARRDKGDYMTISGDALEAQGGERLFDDLAIAEAGWVRPAELRQAYRTLMGRLRAGGAPFELDLLWGVYAMDCWYRHALTSALPSRVSA